MKSFIKAIGLVLLFSNNIFVTDAIAQETMVVSNDPSLRLGDGYDMRSGSPAKQPPATISGNEKGSYQPTGTITEKASFHFATSTEDSTRDQSANVSGTFDILKAGVDASAHQRQHAEDESIVFTYSFRQPLYLYSADIVQWSQAFGNEVAKGRNGKAEGKLNDNELEIRQKKLEAQFGTQYVAEYDLCAEIKISVVANFHRHLNEKELALATSGGYADVIDLQATLKNTSILQDSSAQYDIFIQSTVADAAPTAFLNVNQSALVQTILDQVQKDRSAINILVSKLNEIENKPKSEAQTLELTQAIENARLEKESILRPIEELKGPNGESWRPYVKIADMTTDLDTALIYAHKLAFYRARFDAVDKATWLKKTTLFDKVKTDLDGSFKKLCNAYESFCAGGKLSYDKQNIDKVLAEAGGFEWPKIIWWKVWVSAETDNNPAISWLGYMDDYYFGQRRPGYAGYGFYAFIGLVDYGSGTKGIARSADLKLVYYDRTDRVVATRLSVNRLPAFASLSMRYPITGSTEKFTNAVADWTAPLQFVNNTQGTFHRDVAIKTLGDSANSLLSESGSDFVRKYNELMANNNDSEIAWFAFAIGPLCDTEGELLNANVELELNTADGPHAVASVPFKAAVSVKNNAPP